MRAELQQKMRVLVTMWGAITMATFLFGVVLYVVGPAEDASGELSPILAGFGVVMAFAAFAWRWRVLGPTLGLWAPPQNQDGPPATPLKGAALDEALEKTFAQYQAGTFVGLAMGEAVAILGFIATFLSGDFTWYLALVTLSSVVLVVQVPRLDGLIGVAEPGLREALRRDR